MSTQKKFGTLPVFLTAISTILGAVMFLRFGYAVGNVGFIGTIGIILIGHMVTIPTAMAIAEIATNQKVEGGGEYFIISRSFGLNIGSAIGISLYLSQAISVAFYIVAMGVAFEPLVQWIGDTYGFYIMQPQLITLPCLGLLTLLVLTKGADLGMKALYFVVAILFISLIMFFVGTGNSQPLNFDTLTAKVEGADAFFVVFAICFPAFTGMTAGVGLSGDLKDPSVSIPKGTLWATIAGLVIYVFIALKLAISASAADLDSNELIMANIAIWGPIIPIGLAAATFSSALGSFLVAPRTLQALGKDEIFPNEKVNQLLSSGKGKNKEPYFSSLVTLGIATIFVAIGDVNFVAEIISMFFMVTYGALCLISFFQHFSGDPSYRPKFKSKWYISLFGGIMCVFMMFKMNPFYAVLAILLMLGLYYYISSKNDKKAGISAIFQGVMFQFSRTVQVFLQKSEKDKQNETWRPSIVAFSNQTFVQNSNFQVMKWMTRKHGFGSYIHWIKDELNEDSVLTSKETLERMIRLSNIEHSNFYLQTHVAPSYTGALVQMLQLPGVSGKENNMILLDYERGKMEQLDKIKDNYTLMCASNYDVGVLSTSQKGFGVQNDIHIWIEGNQTSNAQMMIVIAYIILGSSDWIKGNVTLHVALNESVYESEKIMIEELVFTGSLPIAQSNLCLHKISEGETRNEKILKYSQDADLIMIGFNGHTLEDEFSVKENELKSLCNILYINSNTTKNFGMDK
jgi:amino acid transporter